MMFGCHWFHAPDIAIPPQTNAIVPTEMPRNRDVVGIEVYFVRLSPLQADLLRQLWLEVDELVISNPELRNELLKNGFRVGVQGAVLSKTLSQLLQISETGATGHHEQAAFTEVNLLDIAKEADVERTIWNLLPDMQAKVTLFPEPLPDLSLFHVGASGLLRGKTYYGVQCHLSLSATPEHDGRVLFQLLPEIDYGSAVAKYEFKSGLGYMKNRRPRVAFADLRVPLSLYPGQWIIVGQSPDKNATLGRAFFTRDDGREEKLMVIRLAHMNRRATDPNISTVPEPAKPSDWIMQDRR